MPSGSSESVVDIVADTISLLEATIKQFPDHLIICGGDFNANLSTSSPVTLIIHKFMQDYGLVICDKTFSKKVNILSHTYCHEALKHYSYIDYFLMSKSIVDQVRDFDILECAINMSDHNAILTYIRVENNLLPMNNSYEATKPVTKTNIVNTNALLLKPHTLALCTNETHYEF